MSSTQKPVISEKKPSNRREQRAQAQSFIDSLQGEAFPNSRRIYLEADREDIRVPMREIQLSPTLVGGGKDNPQFEENEAIPVYDTAGPYGDPAAVIDVHTGLGKLRARWINERADTQELSQVSSGFTQQRLADDGQASVRRRGVARTCAGKARSSRPFL